MKGLVLKDFYSLKSYTKMLSFILIFLISVWSISKSYSVATFMISFMIMTVSCSTYAYDEASHWEEFSVTLPLSPNKIVGSKYISTILINAIGFLLCALYCFLVMVLGGGLTLQDSVFSISICILIACFYIGFILPLSYRFGSQKMKLFTIAIFSLPTLIVLLIAKLSPKFISTVALENMLNSLLQNSFLTFIVSVLIGLAFVFLSYIVSVKIFKKKQF